MNKRHMTEDVQRHIAHFTTAGGIQAHKGDDFLGHPSIVADMKRCVCALCIGGPHLPQQKCTMFTDAGGAIVQIKSEDICKPVCLSNRGVLNMIQRFVKGMLEDLAAVELVAEESPIINRPVTLRFSLRRDTVAHSPLPLEPYVVDVFWEKDPSDTNGDLFLTFFKTLNDMDDHDVRIPNYHLGERLRFSEHMPPQELFALEKKIFHLLMSTGERYSIVASGALPVENFTTQSGIHFQFSNRNFPHAVSTPIYLTVISHIKQSNP